jgi:response regulator RpfG family c-di-GMP phosphodiesterase
VNKARQRILCVDDERANLNLLEAFLVPRGYETVRAENGTEALEKIEEGRIDLVLLDVMMPRLDGFEVCRKIKENERHRNIPVVMITALASKRDRIAGIEAGAEDFITKPFDQGEVLARVKMLLAMKALGDKLNSAYGNITNLTTFGEKILKTFNPLDFDFMSNIDSIIRQIMKRTPETTGMPETIIVGVKRKRNTWDWFKYDLSSDRLNKKPIGLGLHKTPGLSGGDAGTVGFFNASDLNGPGFQPFIRALESINITASNMVYYQGRDLFIYAVNYDRDVTGYDAQVLNSMAMQSRFLKSLVSQVEETESAFDYVVYALARAAEANDEDTGNHIVRVGRYCVLIAEKLGMPRKFTDIIRIQSTLHDVGKIHIKPEILKKSGNLTPEEWESVKKHPVYGAAIIGEHVRLTMAKNIAISHHERWDGSGYPFGLKGAEISIEGRIANIADQYDALRNPRLYKPPYDHETTCTIILEGDGKTMPSHFDPEMLRAFREIAPQFQETYEADKANGGDAVPEPEIMDDREDNQ